MKEEREEGQASPPATPTDSSPRSADKRGYSLDADALSERVGRNGYDPSQFQEEEEWSHVDSNHGPPACEKGRENVRRRPRTSQVVDGKRLSKTR